MGQAHAFWKILTDFLLASVACRCRLVRAGFWQGVMETSFESRIICVARGLGVKS